METSLTDSIDTQETARQRRIRELRDLFLTLMWMGHRQMVRRLQAHDLSHPQFISLACLVAHKQPASMTELTEVTFQDAPATTRIVDRLVRMGWARRTRTENDRRVVLVEATQKGRRLIETIRDDLDQVNDLGFSSLSDVELTRIEALFDSVLAICLQQYGQDRLDLAQIKQEFRGFANDPIRFLKTHKLTES